MADTMVLEAQKWLNSNYSGIEGWVKASEDGITGSLTFQALTRALQIELNKTLAPSEQLPITGTFGDKTKAACPTLSQSSEYNVFVKILQYGLFCKGYNAGDTDGVFKEKTSDALLKLQNHAGLSESQQTSDCTPLVFQAVLSTEYYEKVSTGNSKVREIQQYLNRQYLDYIGIQPCDGVYGRNTVQSLIFALQAEENMPANVANGYFGSNTKSCCPHLPYSNEQTDHFNKTYSSGKIERFILLFQYCLYCYGANYSRFTNSSKYNPGSFNGEFDSNTIKALNSFQEDHALPVRDQATLDEWMQLMLSTGNPDRKCTAIDCATRLTQPKCQALKDAGYQIVGRYLTGDIVVENTRVAKNLLRPEMKAIFDSGLRLFVIFQDPREYYKETPNNDIHNYFDYDRGYSDAEKAFSAAKTLGVPRGEIIYFAVDYDFYSFEVNSKIIPYFEGIKQYINDTSPLFKVGIYGARNICSMVSEKGLSVSSFVSDMSTGYSGNMGFPMPEDWAFDQIREYKFLKSTDGSFGIDNNVVSGRYTGFNNFEQKNDNEWDIILGNGYAHVLYTNGRNSYPLGKGELPVYWAKVKDENGNFVAKYPMYDSIKVGAFYSRRLINLNRNDASGDKIRYVYFRDVGGRLNAGYIDESLIEGAFETNSGKFMEGYFGEVVVRRDADNPNNVFMYRNVDPGKAQMLLTVETKAYTDSGTLHSTLPVGTKVEIVAVTSTGRSFPHLIQCTSKMLPERNEWEYLIPGASYGFIDLGFEVGVMPEDRSMITGYGGIPNFN